MYTQPALNLFEIAMEIVNSPTWSVNVFSSKSNPEKTKLLCLRYTEVLNQHGFSNIMTSDPDLALLEGVFHVYIENKQMSC